MKTLFLSFIILISTPARVLLAGDDYAALDNFHAAKARWDAATGDVAMKKTGALAAAESAFTAMLSAWSKVSPELQKARYDELNRTWYTMAELSANRGEYKRALGYLDSEMRYQYSRNNRVFLSGQNRSFFRNVIKLETKILGHLGRKYYLNTIDYYLMPVDVDHDGMDEFVAMECTSADEEAGITIPPLPENEERKIIYLLASDEKGDYAVKDSVQLIGKPDKETRIAVLEAENPPVVALGGITHRVKIKDGVPFKYLPLPTPFIKFKVTSKGFEEITGSN